MGTLGVAGAGVAGLGGLLYLVVGIMNFGGIDSLEEAKTAGGLTGVAFGCFFLGIAGYLADRSAGN